MLEKGRFEKFNNNFELSSDDQEMRLLQRDYEKKNEAVLAHQLVVLNQLRQEILNPVVIGQTENGTQAIGQNGDFIFNNGLFYSVNGKNFCSLSSGEKINNLRLSKSADTLLVFMCKKSRGIGKSFGMTKDEMLEFLRKTEHKMGIGSLRNLIGRIKTAAGGKEVDIISNAAVGKKHYLQYLNLSK